MCLDAGAGRGYFERSFCLFETFAAAARLGQVAAEQRDLEQELGAGGEGGGTGAAKDQSYAGAMRRVACSVEHQARERQQAVVPAAGGGSASDLAQPPGTDGAPPPASASRAS